MILAWARPLSRILLGLLIFPLLVWGQKEQAGETVETLPSRTSRAVSYREYYALKTSLAELRRQLDQLRVDVEAYRSREMAPDVYRTILKRLKPPKMTHEVMLTNGTVVRGNIISEDIDHVTLETGLGNLILDKSTVSSVREISEIKPKLDFVGDAREEIDDTLRVFSGTIRNTGVTRGDFVRAVFLLWNAKTELVAMDSSFVNGATTSYLSGVVADTAVEPGQEVAYQVRVKVPRDSPVSYITREIRWDQLD